MEDGTKQVIPLDSGLDVHSSEMLVPVGDPKFQHNRQRFQGKYLPSSVRFEHDGYAAGDDVYQFIFNENKVEVDNIIITKYTLNNNPTYNIIFSDSEGKQIGNVNFINENSIKSSTTDTCEVSFGVNPIITGTVNGKEFTINYDSVTGDFENATPEESTIILLSSSIQSDYKAELRLQDNSVNVEVTFSGLTFPSDSIINTNGNYTLGTFSIQTGNISTWSNGAFTYEVDVENKTLNIKNASNENIYSATIQLDDEGNCTHTFSLDISFNDNVSVSTASFIPMFTDIVVEQNSSTVATEAYNEIAINKWTASIQDREHTNQSNIYNQNKLYKNLPESSGGRSDYNKQTLQTILPVWAGFSLEPGIVDIIPSNVTPGPIGTVLVDTDGFDISGIGPTYTPSISDGNFERPSAKDFVRSISFSTTSKCNLYYSSSGSIYNTKFPNVRVWENTTDITSRVITNHEYISAFSNNSKVHVTVTINCDLRYFDTNNDSGTDSLIIIAECDINPRITNFDSIADCISFDLGGASGRYTHSSGSSTQYVSFSISSYTTSVKYKFPDDLSDGGTIIIAPVSSDLFGSAIIKFNNIVSQFVQWSGPASAIPTPMFGNNGYYYTQTSTSDNGRAWVGWCCKMAIASDIYIKQDTTLNNSNISLDTFEIVPTTVTGSYADVSHLFYHKAISCGMQNNSYLLQIALCAKEVEQRIFYTTQRLDEIATFVDDEGNVTQYLKNIKYMPSYIMYNSLSMLENEEGYMTYTTVKRNYTANTIDSTYSFIHKVLLTPVQTKKYTDFVYMTSMYSGIDYDTDKYMECSFINDTKNIASEITYSVNEPTWYIDIDTNSRYDSDFVKDAVQQVDLLLNGEIALSGVHDLSGQALQLTGEIDYLGYKIKTGIALKDASSTDNLDINLFYITFSYSNLYNIVFKTLKLLNDEYKVVSYTSTQLLTISNSNEIVRVEIDYMRHTVTMYNNRDGSFNELEPEVTWLDNNGVYLISNDIRYILAVLFGVYSAENVVVTGLTNLSMSVTIQDKDISFSLNELFSNNISSFVKYVCTNINEETLVQNEFAKVDIAYEYQLIKQQWDTTNHTENFWWIDSDNVLVLTKYFFILRTKATSVNGYDGVLLSDWDGDVFLDSATFNRDDILDTTVKRYLCTCAYNGAYSRFLTISADSNSSNIFILKIYDPLGNMQSGSVRIPIIKRNLGTQLNAITTQLNTYSDINVDTFISQSKFSATCIGTTLIFGVHYDNNFNQWAVIINLSNFSIQNVIQGYGFVGVNGCLTGGEIPTAFFNAQTGFIGTVQPLSILSDTNKNITNINDIYNITDKVVGNDSQQWYITKNIKSIVSHLTYGGNGNFVINELPINNNYAVEYASGSYVSGAESNNYIKNTAFADILGTSGAVSIVLGVAGWPSLYTIAPRVTSASYLQQTLGQAAYVHYNSTNMSKQKDVTHESDISNFSEEEATATAKEKISPISEDEVSFDRQSIKQSVVAADPYTSAFMTCAAALTSAAEFAKETLQVNKTQNQMSASDQGKKFSQNFLQNVNSLLMSDMTMQSVVPAQVSEVTAIKTLDMFYSTSDRQNVKAGPGYVNHNFVAQCVAQSVTSVQAEFAQQKLLLVLSFVTQYDILLKAEIAAAATYALEKQLEATAPAGAQSSAFGVGAGTGYMLAAVALAAAATVSRTAENVLRASAEVMPTICNALGGDKMQSSITARLSKHVYDIEGKHRYGSKTECFMWPCFGVNDRQQIVDESVTITVQNKPWKVNMSLGRSPKIINNSVPSFTNNPQTDSVRRTFEGDVSYYIAMVKGQQKNVSLPSNMAYVIGTESFLPANDFKNENIGESDPVFPTAPFQDYIIDDSWQLGQTSSDGMTVWISVKDTKIIDGEYSNVVCSGSFCGVASPYTAIEVKRGIQQRYLRPWAITPKALALNITGLNCCFEEKAYHAFDGFGYRIVSWCGSAGMNKEKQTWLYSFLTNDRFKRSNKMPQNEYLGNFKSDPTVATYGDHNDKVFTLVTQPGEGKGLTSGTIGEDKDVRRYAIPVFSEFVNTLPAAVKTVAAQVLTVVDGITSLTTENRDLQTAYKSPISVDFIIGKNKYRYTQEYICTLNNVSGVTIVQDTVPCLGLDFIGSTPYEAYFYSQATKQYYTFTGGTSLNVVDMIERFRNVISGKYDFVNQEVIMPCVATFLRLDKHVLDDEDETDNVIVPRLKNQMFVGEVAPPIDTIYNTRSGFRTLSLPSGVVYQGPNRCIINRFVVQDYMIKQIKDNYGNWERVPREVYHPFRKYRAKYEIVERTIGNDVVVKGWTHNPFLLVTAPIGVSNEIDCMFEWEVTFTWPVEMDKLYDANTYATVNIQAETMTPGGKVIAARPTHVFLTKELFTRTGNYGYYSFRYQSRCGAGNRERLHIWSDQYICVSSLQVEYKVITTKRTEILTQQVDVQDMNEI